MFEREGKREKILEVRNRELRLKLKAKASSHAVIGEEQAEQEVEQPDEVFIDKTVMAAEAEFYEVIRSLTKSEEPEEEAPGEIAQVIEPEPEPEPEPEAPPPPPTPEPKPKKKGKKQK